MYHNILVALSLGCILLTGALSPLQAAPVPLIDAAGDDSGWTVESGGAALDLISADIIDVDLSARTVTIHIEKDFGPFEEFLGEIIFPIGSVTFAEVNPNADLIDTIIIQSETIANNTGLAWNGFSWQVSPESTGSFDTAASSGWTVTPFGDKLFATDHKLLAIDGSVPDSATFVPTGNLVIDIHTDSSDGPLAITLKQHITPEPVSIALIAAGIPFVLRRRRKSS